MIEVEKIHSMKTIIEMIEFVHVFQMDLIILMNKFGVSIMNLVTIYYKNDQILFY